MAWDFLTNLLNEIHNYATCWWKIWLTAFIVFRIVLTVVAGESIYHDEQSNFICNTHTPGCSNVCYNDFAPLSHVRFWVFEIIVMAIPSLIYLGFAINKIAQTQEMTPARQQHQQHLQHVLVAAGDGQQPNEMAVIEQNAEWTEGWSGGNEENYAGHDGRQRIKQNGLMCMYVFHVLARTLLEVCFLVIQCTLYGFSVPDVYKCTTKPCLETVDCYISRRSEKILFLGIMYGVSILCLVIDAGELLHLATGPGVCPPPPLFANTWTGYI